MDVRRTLDGGLLNRCANDPAVRPFIGNIAAGELDLSGFLDVPFNVALVFEHGAFAFEQHEHGRYEVHTFILPAGRGAGVVPASLAAARWMFTHTDAIEILTKVPETNKPADIMCRRAGFAPVFRRESAWEDGSAITFFALTLDAWRERDDETLAMGRAFHEALERAKAAVGSHLPTHADDAAHDRAVGASLLMARAGNARKAVHLYNRWARFAGYAPGALLNDAPATFDVGDAIVAFTPELEILKCRVEH